MVRTLRNSRSCRRGTFAIAVCDDTETVSRSPHQLCSSRSGRTQNTPTRQHPHRLSKRRLGMLLLRRHGRLYRPRSPNLPRRKKRMEQRRIGMPSMQQFQSRQPSRRSTKPRDLSRIVETYELGFKVRAVRTHH